MKKSISIFFLLCYSIVVAAQQAWPSVEVEQMYVNAQQYANAGNYTSAITTYKQAILLAPKVMVLYRDLGNALLLAGKYKEAVEVLQPLTENKAADAQTYQVLAAAHAALQHSRQALASLKKGLQRFPDSGLLYYHAGVIYKEAKKDGAALGAWLDGIQKDAAYAANYRQAAQVYLGSQDVLWGILYGETYLLMQHDTLHDDELKGKLFAAYKTMFDHIADDGVPVYGKEINALPVKNFEDAVLQVYSTLTPLVSDGVSTENLTMVRVRFLMEWFSGYAEKYPCSLFTYQDMMLRNGRLDMCSEWLFGKAESLTEYTAWRTYHDGDMERFLKWQGQHFYVPDGGMFYNTRMRIK